MSTEVPTHLTITDFFLSVIYVGILFFICWEIISKHSHISYYKFFLPGIAVKFLGAVIACIVYIYYYPEGGDTLWYFHSSKVVGNLIFNHPETLFKIIFLNDISKETLSQFNSHTGWPDYINDSFSFFLVRIITPLSIISFGNYFVCSILLASISYSGVWKLYTVFCKQFPSLMNEMAMAVLFIPSVVFFGSGIFKDTVTFSALGWFVYALYNILNKKYSLKYFLIILISSYCLLSIKPYILYGILAASSIWCTAYYLKSKSLRIMRYIYAPAIIILFSIASSLIILHVGKNRERFSIDEMQKSMTTRRHGHDPSPPRSKFNVKPIENSFSSLLKNAPLLINTTLFRPYIWETKKNIMMIFFALETSFMLAFILLLLYKFKIIFLFPHLFSHPFLIFSTFFVLIFSFIVGISTDNFGTLARFRIPVLPFFVASCFILNEIYSNEK